MLFTSFFGEKGRGIGISVAPNYFKGKRYHLHEVQHHHSHNPLRCWVGAMDTSANVALGYVYMLVSTTSCTAMAAVSKILGTCASTEEKVVISWDVTSVGWWLLNLPEDIDAMPAAIAMREVVNLIGQDLTPIDHSRWPDYPRSNYCWWKKSR